MERDDAVYVISVAAELAGMHPQTLRTYERKGLIEPQRTGGNTRRYSARDVDRLRLIAHLTQEEGLNLAGVRMVLDMHEQLQRMRERAARLEQQLDTVMERMRDEVIETTGRFEIVPTGRAQIEPHPRFPRSTRHTPDRRRDERRES